MPSDVHATVVDVLRGEERGGKPEPRRPGYVRMDNLTHDRHATFEDMRSPWVHAQRLPVSVRGMHFDAVLPQVGFKSRNEVLISVHVDGHAASA